MNNVQLLTLVESGLLSSSSSSDSSDDEQLLNSINNGHLHSKPKIQNFVEKVVHTFTDDEFMRNFRLSRHTVYKIISNFEKSNFYPKYAAGKQTVSAEAHILMFLWFAGNKTVMRITAQVFNCSESTFFVVFNRVIDYLLSCMPDVIRMPYTTEEKYETANEFKRIAGIPDVLGAIDGSYISIRKPKHKIRSTYVNRHHDCSITLQAICNAKKKCIDVFTGTPGKMHDARILQKSFVYKEQYLHQVCGSKYHILADSAYPLEENIITPFKDHGNLTYNEKQFNKRHSKTRVVIENTFGLLKGRFRQLLKLDFALTEKDSNFVLACCVLHNMCTETDDFFIEQLLPDVPQDLIAADLRPSALDSRSKGIEKRKTLCNI